MAVFMHLRGFLAVALLATLAFAPPGRTAPGVPRGVALDHFVLNIDFAPTFAELAAARADHPVDGRSLVALLGDSPLPADGWRQDFLVEIYRPTTPPPGVRFPPGVVPGDEIRALRTRDMLYVEFASGPRELYDLTADPYQLQSLHETATPALMAELSARLSQLATCTAGSCR